MNKDMEIIRTLYVAIIGWDGLVIDGKRIAREGEYTIHRASVEWLEEGIKEYLKKWKDRDAYLIMALEEKTRNNGLTTSIDHTERIRKKLGGK